MQSAAASWRPIGTVLVEAGAIDESQLQAALAEQKQSGRRLGEILIDSGAITWNALAHAIAAQVQAIDEPDAPTPAPMSVPPAASARPLPAPVHAVPAVTRFDVGSDNRLEAVEAMLRERQRAFLELVSTTETLRRAVAKLQDEIAEKDAEIARLRLQSIAS
jgi:type IV pilus assembly protein PilB